MANRIGTPFARVRVGDDLFQSGDGKLKNAEVTLAEGSGLSGCRFSIYDRARVYTNKYFTYIFKNDGLDPLFIPSKTQNRNRGSGSSGSNVSFNGNASISGFDSARIKTAIEYYIGQGLTPQGAAALIGSMMQESGLNPSASNTELGAPGDPSTPEGLIQWRFERKDGMPGDYEGQLAFALEEMNRDAGGAGLEDKLKDPNVTLSDLQGPFQDWIRWGTGETGNRWDYAEQVLKAIEDNRPQAAQRSVQQAQQPEQENTQQVLTAKVGQQITLELGFDGQTIAAYSFLHTGLEFDLFAPEALVFSGQAAAWVLTQRKRNTAYTNLTLKQIAQRICEKYGLSLAMETDGPNYQYFHQRGQTDYDALLIECRRIGYRMQSVGNQLKIGPRVANDNGFTLVYGENLGTEFKVTHTAASDSSGGARSSDGSDRSTTGERKWIVDPDSGELIQQRSENTTGAGASGSTADASTTGNHVTTITPTTKSDDTNDRTRKENEKRLKGIGANFSAPTLPEMLLLDPDSIFRTAGISEFLDRAWVIESITHTYDGRALKTNGSIYTPLKNKYPSSSGGNTTGSRSPSPAPAANPGGFIKPTDGIVTSSFGPRGGRLHAGVDLGADVGTPVVASAGGTVVGAYGGCVEGDSGCNGRAGNYIIVDHGNGFTTRYLHLNSFSVAAGDTVKQGQQIGELGNTGDSTGPHLHFEILQGGNPVDPESQITF